MKRILNQRQIREFTLHLENEERSKATLEKYLRDLRAFHSYVGQFEITRQTVLDYKAMLIKKYAVASANSMLAAINCFFRFVGWHDLSVKQFKVQKSAFCNEEKELTRAEYFRLLSAAKSKKCERLNLIIQTICATGIRVSELEYITLEAVKNGEAVVFCKGKNRRVFIVKELKKKLLLFAKEQKIESGIIFRTRNGRPISRHAVWKEMKGLCESAGVSATKVFPHNLRHLFARTFYSIEKDIAKLADILGHASINTTRIYIVTSGREHKRKMENMRLVS